MKKPDMSYIEDRKNICSKCDKFTKFGRCSVCGCFLVFKYIPAKAKCPLGKW